MRLALTRILIMDALTAAASVVSMDVDGYAVEILQGGSVGGSAAGAAASEAEVEVDTVDKEKLSSGDALRGHEDVVPKVRNSTKLPCHAPCT